jgi:TfoX/Sxy family transcriptional regulator of competence genes
MTADEELLAARIRARLAGQDHLVEKRMFGGIGFMLHGNMACGVCRGQMIARVGVQVYADTLKQPNVKVFDVTGRPMTGWVMVDPAGLETDPELYDWIEIGVAVAATLPPK